MAENLKGYKGKGKELLTKYKIEIWDIIQIKTDKGDYEGIVLPRNEYSAPDYIEIKLVRINPDYGLIPSSSRIGVGVPNNITDYENVFPTTEHNLKVLREHKKLRNEGWKLIEKADSMRNQFEPFPKNHFKKILKRQW